MTTADRVDPPVFRARGISKQYGGVHALDGVDFEIYAGEVVALVGNNGAGKSTFVKVINGVVAPDTGELLLDGAVVDLHSPDHARRLGIDTVYQDLALAGDLTYADNIFLGREIVRSGWLGRFGVVDRKTMYRQSDVLLGSLGVELPHGRYPVGLLSGGQRQSIAISRAVSWASRLLIMDEPTAALGVTQTRSVLNLIQRVRDEGIAVVLVSHNMAEVFEVADRVIVFRLGRRAATFDRASCTPSDVVAAITGADVAA
jgi:simple sugar transport system ATP-binding protein